jgi:hypothetical protein
MIQQEMEQKFDPSDTDGAMHLAYACISVLKHGARAIWAEERGMRMGRDTCRELFVGLTHIAERLRLVPFRPNGEQISELWSKLYTETGLTAPSPAQGTPEPPTREQLLSALRPFTEIQPPYDHDNECSFCRTPEGQTHPETCSWEIAKILVAGLAGPQNGQGWVKLSREQLEHMEWYGGDCCNSYCPVCETSERTMYGGPINKHKPHCWIGQALEKLAAPPTGDAPREKK